jgi:hypothetical protein
MGMEWIRLSPAVSLRASAKKYPFAQTGKTSSSVAFPLTHLLLVVGSRGGREEEEPGKKEEAGEEGRAPAGELRF